MSNSNEIAQIELINAGLTITNTQIDKLATGYLTVIKHIQSYDAVIKGVGVNTEALTKLQKDALEVEKQKEAFNKKLIAATEDLKRVEDGSLKTLLEKKLALKAETDAITESITGKKAAAEAEKKLTAEKKAAEAATKLQAAATAKAAIEEKKKAEIDALAETSLTKMRITLKGLIKEFDDSEAPSQKLTNEISNLREKIDKAEEATGRHQRQVGSYKKSMMDVAREFLGFAGAVGIAVAVVNKLKEAFAETETGVRFFKRIGEASTTFFQNMLSGNVQMTGVNSLIASQLATKLDDLRIEERAEKIKVATLDTEVKLLRLKAAGTKDLTEQKKMYEEADKKENESIAIRKEHLTAEIGVLEALAIVRPKDTKLLDELSQKKVEIIQIEADKSLRIQMKLGALAGKIEDEKAKKIKDAEEYAKKAFEDRVTAVEVANNQELIKINQSYVDRKITDVQFKLQLEKQEIAFLNAKQALYQKDSKEWTAFEVERQNVSIKVREAILADIKKHGTLENSAERAIESGKEKLRADGLKSNQKYLDSRLKQIKEEADKEKQIQENLKKAKEDLAKDSLNAVFEFRNLSIQKEMNALQVEKDAKLTNAKLTTEQRAKIEADYTKKANELKAKQARNEKIQALFSIALNTAMGATNAASKVVTLPLVPFIIAQGLIQAALVMAQPIPKYKAGTLAAERRGIFGEAGRELLFPVGGGAIMADKATYFQGNEFKGARIFSNPETEKLIGSTDRHIHGKSMTDERILKALGGVESAIKNKPLLIMNNEYKVIGQGTSTHQEIILNRLMRNN